MTRGKKATIAAFAIVAVILVAGAMFYFLRGDRGGHITADSEPQQILADNFTVLTDSIINMVGLSSEMPLGFSLNESTQTVHSSVSLYGNMSDRFINDLVNAFGIPGDAAQFLRLFSNTELNWSTEIDLSSRLPEIISTAVLRLAGENLLSVNLSMDRDGIYFHVPELYSRYFGLSFDDIGLDINEIVDLLDIIDLDALLNEFNYYGYGGPLEDWMHFIEANEEAVRQLISDFTVGALDALGDMKLDEGTEVVLGGETVRYYSISLTITDELVYTMAQAGIEAILENSAHVQTFTDFANMILAMMGDWPVTQQEIREELEYLAAELYAGYGDGDETLFDLTIFINDAGRIQGADIMLPEGRQIRGIFDLLNGFEFIFSDEYEFLRIYGNLRGGTANLSGDVSFEYRPVDTRYANFDRAMSARVLAFKGLNVSDMAGNQDFEITLFVGDLIREFAGDEPSEMTFIARFLSEMTVTLAVKTQDKSSALLLTVALGTDASFSLSATVSERAALSRPATPPTGQVIAIDDNTFNQVNFFEIIRNVEGLLAKLEGMGLDTGFVDGLLDSLISEMLLGMAW